MSCLFGSRFSECGSWFEFFKRSKSQSMPRSWLKLIALGITIRYCSWLFLHYRVFRSGELVHLVPAICCCVKMWPGDKRFPLLRQLEDFFHRNKGNVMWQNLIIIRIVVFNASIFFIFVVTIAAAATLNAWTHCIDWSTWVWVGVCADKVCRDWNIIAIEVWEWLCANMQLNGYLILCQ